MASIYQRGKKGIWQIQYMEGGRQKRESLHTASKQKAEYLKAQLEQRLAAGIPSAHKADSTLTAFNDALEPHVKLTRRPATVRVMLHVWRQFLDWANPANLSDVTKHDIEGYKTKLLTDGIAPSTARMRIATLGAVYTIAIKELHLFDGPSPVSGVELPKKHDREPKFLSREQIGAMLRAAEMHGRDMHLFCALGIFAGLRQGEILAARWHWFDLDREPGVVYIKCSDGFRTKSGRDRHMPMHVKLRPVLERYRLEGQNPDAFVCFPEVAAKPPPADRVQVRSRFNVISKTAGCSTLQDGQRCTPHALRHTFATQLAMAGVSLYDIMHYMGHTKVDVTQIYARYCPVDRAIDF